MSRSATSGPMLIGIPGTTLDETSRQALRHPAVGGVVLFTRNFHDRDQLVELVAAIRDSATPRPLVCIDQEGGRVQRLRDGFTPLPALGVIGRLFSTEPARAADFAYRHARVMAAEMLACGIDLSFAPVLDLDRGSSVIGDRSFSPVTETVVRLGKAYLAGMHDAGMKTTGKHYPGHGSVAADSHTDDVVDGRSLAELEQADLAPFTQLASQLDALMIAHVVYPRIDSVPAGYSRTWLRQILRSEAGYRGVIMSDDLGMKAACVAGGIADRYWRCLESGCDLALVCRPEDVEELLAQIDEPSPDATRAIASLYGECRLSHAEMAATDAPGGGEWRQWQSSLTELGKNPGLKA